MNRNPLRVIILTALIIGASAGCGGSSDSTPIQSAPQTQPLVYVIGQYDLVLTSSKGGGDTNVYTNFFQTGTTFTGNTSTLVCPSNDLSQCIGGAPDIFITPTGTITGTNLTLAISFPSATGPDTIMMAGSVHGKNLAGTYTDSLGDSGAWTGSSAIYLSDPFPSVYNFSGTFNSTSNPLPILPTILMGVGQNQGSDINIKLSGSAAIMNSPCFSSLNLSGQAIGDALSLTDAANKVSILVLPNMPVVDTYTFSYKIDPSAASCAGDSGRGNLTINYSPWDY